MLNRKIKKLKIVLNKAINNQIQDLINKLITQL